VAASAAEYARWNAERQPMEFGVEIGEYRGVVQFAAVRRTSLPAGRKSDGRL